MTTRTYTFEGAHAAETACGALNAIDLPDESGEVQMDINSSAWDADTPTTVRYSGPDPETGLRAALKDADGLMSATYVRLEITKGTESTQASDTDARSALPETDGGIQCVPPSNAAEDDRKLKQISAGTNMATLLREVAERDGYVSANTLREESEVSSGSVGPALSKLWERRHVERQRTESPGREFEYQLSEYGRVELKRLEGHE